MNRFDRLMTLTAALVAWTGAAQASAWDKKTIASFSQAIEVPGTVLEPGKYVMKLLDLPADRHVVQFMNERENHVYATAMAIPTYREQVTGYTAITFYEAPAGQPQAIRTWFYPGDNYGQEFLYPKGRGGPRLAAYTPPVAEPSLNNRSEVKITPEPVNPPPLPAEAVPAPSATEAPPEPIEIAQAATPAPRPETTPVAPAPAPAPAPSPAELPKTAGNSSEITLAGLFALGGAAAVRKLRKPVS